MPAPVRNPVLRRKGPEGPYIAMTFWESEEAFRARTGSPSSARATPVAPPCPRRLSGARTARKLMVFSHSEGSYGQSLHRGASHR
ncbi:antibiotic biosynthesis monooxygenase [Meiothermus sp.]|uniref:antibiotic biosynthesis monooxygenase family protein n=1 Tax=Meiothermus sp. TaxID=1955249 RepID=UPI00345BAC68